MLLSSDKSIQAFKTFLHLSIITFKHLSIITFKHLGIEDIH
jgi:hypothetical protein